MCSFEFTVSVFCRRSGVRLGLLWFTGCCCVCCFGADWFGSLIVLLYLFLNVVCAIDFVVVL